MTRRIRRLFCLFGLHAWMYDFGAKEIDGTELVIIMACDWCHRRTVWVESMGDYYDRY